MRVELTNRELAVISFCLGLAMGVAEPGVLDSAEVQAISRKLIIADRTAEHDEVRRIVTNLALGQIKGAS